jgi:hypothetical protein
MFLKSLATASVLVGIGVLTVTHLPKPAQKIVMKPPAWLQAVIVHFGYGYWVGGVTGHLVAGLMSIPWFFVSHYWLRPRILGIPAEPISRILEGLGEKTGKVTKVPA